MEERRAKARFRFRRVIKRQIGLTFVNAALRNFLCLYIELLIFLYI